MSLSKASDRVSTTTEFFFYISSEERFCDSTLVSNGKFFPVHRLVLSSCSEYFEEIFEKTPCKHPFVIIKDIEPALLEAILNFIYEGEVRLSHKSLLPFIEAAESLKIKGLDLSPCRENDDNSADDEGFKIKDLIQDLANSLNSPGKNKNPVTYNCEQTVSDGKQDDPAVHCMPTKQLHKTAYADNNEDKNRHILDPIVPLKRINFGHKSHNGKVAGCRTNKKKRKKAKKPKCSKIGKFARKIHIRDYGNEFHESAVIDGPNVEDLKPGYGESSKADDRMKIVSVSGGDNTEFETGIQNSVESEEQSEVKIELIINGEDNCFDDIVQGGAVQFSAIESSLHFQENVPEASNASQFEDFLTKNAAYDEKNEATDDCIAQCKYCSYNCSSKRDMKNHLAVDHFRLHQKYKCSMCPFATNSLAFINAHVVSHTQESLKCKYCWYRSIYPCHVIMHEKRVHAPLLKKPKDEVNDRSDISGVEKNVTELKDLSVNDDVKNSYICHRDTSHCAGTNPGASNNNANGNTSHSAGTSPGASNNESNSDISHCAGTSHGASNNDGNRDTSHCAGTNSVASDNDANRNTSHCAGTSPGAISNNANSDTNFGASTSANSVDQINPVINDRLLKCHCSGCSFTTSNIGALKRHLLKHRRGIHQQDSGRFRKRIQCTKVGRMACSLCPYKTIRPGKFLALHESLHSDKNAMKCPDCYYLTNLKTSLVRHQQGVHHKKNYKARTSKKNDKAHTSSHTMAKAKCRLCPYEIFSHKKILSHHEALHNDENALKCAKCWYLTNAKERLLHHQLEVHRKKSDRDSNWKIQPETKVDNNKCLYCSYQSPTRAYHSDHMMMHMGWKPHKCDNCDYMTSFRNNLYTHKYKCHQGESSAIE